MKREMNQKKQEWEENEEKKDNSVIPGFVLVRAVLLLTSIIYIAHAFDLCSSSFHL